MMSMLEPITYKVRSFQSFDENCFTKYVDISSEEYLWLAFVWCYDFQKFE